MSSTEEPKLKADPFAQLKLLDLQELDARADQLRHQRDTLPEIVELAKLAEARVEVDNELRDAQIVVDDLSSEQAKIDADVEQVKARRTRDQDRMDQGLIANPKDLERMQHEMESLQRRISSLEDDELEVMERLEEAQGTRDRLAAQLADLDTKKASLVESRDQKTSDIDGEVGDVLSKREPMTGDLPADLLALYDRLRAAKGVGAAALRARQCGGCMLTLDNAELAKIRSAPSDEVIRCEECQRILVRTAESGL